jgi:nitroreductase
MDVWETIRSRRTVRAFRPDPLSRDEIEDLLRVAARAPSGGNVQPWKVHVVTGEARARLVAAACASFDVDPGGEGPEHAVYPDPLEEPYHARRRRVGVQLYEILDVPREDRAGKLRQFRRNLAFFDAPVGMLFAVDRVMVPIQWTDLGMFIQTLVIAAAARGLGTCPQGMWSLFPRTTREVLGLPEGEIVVCGMALGHADEDAPVNALVSERADLAEFATFHTEARNDDEGPT